MAVRPGRYTFPRQTAVVYGQPAGEAVASEIDSFGASRVFVIASPSVARSLLHRELKAALGTRYVGGFNACMPHSPREDVAQAASAARKLEADLLIAIGGGSVIDTTKAVQALLRFDLDSVEHLSGRGSLASQIVLKRVNSIAIPTTLSGAEFTNVAGITHTARGVKEIFQSNTLYFDTVVLDPDATVGVPDALFLASGIRAVDHCVETLCSNKPSIIGDATSREGLSLLSRSLRRVHADPDDTDARLACQLGTWLSITGFVGGVPVGASHGIGRVIGGALGVLHGHTSCVLLPGVLRWNEPADDGRQARIPEAMDDRDARPFEAVGRLVADLGMPLRLRQLNVDRSHFQDLAEKSLVMLAQPSTSGNSRPIQTTGDVMEILELVY
jgi:maleylacetate reductase